MGLAPQERARVGRAEVQLERSVPRQNLEAEEELVLQEANRQTGQGPEQAKASEQATELRLKQKLAADHLRRLPCHRLRARHQLHSPALQSRRLAEWLWQCWPSRSSSVK